MSVGIMSRTASSSEFDKLNETLQMLSSVSLSLRTSSDQKPAQFTCNENHNNRLRSVVRSGIPTAQHDCVTDKDSDIIMKKLNMFRSGQVSKKVPSRPGFPSSQSFPGQLSGNIYQTTSTSQPSLYPPYGPRVPGIPPKNIRIMTPEELANYEAQTNLQRRQLEERELERRLAMQQLEAQENDEWIKNQELKPDLPDLSSEGQDHSASDVKKNRSSSVPPPKPSRTQLKEIKQELPSKLKFEEVKPTPTMKLDRDGDNVYRDTMSVVKSVLRTNQKVRDSSPDDIFGLVKGIGQALKELCTSLTQEMSALPEQFHREIDMAQKTTNKDLSQIINQTKLVRKFFNTTQVEDYKKCLMAANQVLAMDAKNLLDVVDKARLHKLGQQSPPDPVETEPSSEIASTSTASNTPPPANPTEDE